MDKPADKESDKEFMSRIMNEASHNPPTPNGFNGPTNKDRLRWLWSKDGLECFKPHEMKLFRIPNEEWTNNTAKIMKLL